MAEPRRLETPPLVAGALAVLVAALFLLHDTTDVEITPAARWALGLALAGLCGLVLALRRLRTRSRS